MSKKHKEYLIIPIANIKSKNIANECALEITNDNISENHQKIVLKLSALNPNHDGDVYELMTNEPFYINGSLKALLDLLYKGGQYDSINIESANYLINIRPSFVTIDEVKAFFDEIIASGEAKAYKDLISNILLDSKEELIKKRTTNI